jgi:hypothetical protein
LRNCLTRPNSPVGFTKCEHVFLWLYTISMKLVQKLGLVRGALGPIFMPGGAPKAHEVFLKTRGFYPNSSHFGTLPSPSAVALQFFASRESPAHPDCRRGGIRLENMIENFIYITIYSNSYYS